MKFNLYLAILMAGSLAACGGSGSSTTATPVSTAEAVSSTVASSAASVSVLKATIAQGMVTGFGSVIVNGVHYDVANAAINVDGEAKVESELGVGQILRITGTINPDGRHGKATKVEGESQLRGTIESIDLNTGILVALGQNVIFTPDTFYPENVTAETLAIGDIIKVSGYTNTEDTLVATRIDLKTDATVSPLQLAGEVADIDATALTFTLNGKTVDYSKATLGSDTTLTDGMLVRVRGTVIDDVFVASGALHTSPLAFTHDDRIDKNVGITFAGLAKDVVIDTSFTLNDVTVVLNADTHYEGGNASDLVNGLLVKIEGSVNAENNLVAEKIRLIQQPQVNDNGLVQTVDIQANTFSVNDVTYAANVDTSFHDNGKQKVRLFSLEDLAVGNAVNVRGYKVAATETAPEYMVATRVQRQNAPEAGAGNFNVEVSGAVDSVNGSTLTIAGHKVTVTNATEINDFNDMSGLLSNASGAKFTVKGRMDNNVFVADSINVLHKNTNQNPRDVNLSGN